MLGMIRFPCTLEIVDDNRVVFLIELTGAIHPHITLCTGFPSVLNDFEGSFISMNHLRVIKVFVQFIVEDGQVKL